MARASLLRDLPPAFRWVFAGIFVNRAGTFVAPFLVLYLTDSLGHSAALAGGALAAWGAGGLLGATLAGTAADRVGRRVTLLVCMVGAGFSLALLGLARAPWLIVAAAFLSGATSDGFRPATQAIVADVIEPAQRPRAYSLTFWATNLGFCVAALTGGALAAQGWWLLFAIDALSCTVFGVLIYLRVPETRPDAPAGGLGGSLRVALRDRLLLVMALLFFIQGMTIFQAFSLLPLAVDADGYSPATFGAVIAVNGIIIIVVQPLVTGRLAARSRGLVIAASLLLLGGGMWATALAATPVGFALTVLVWTLGEIGFAAVAFAVVADLAPPHMRGRYNAVVGIAAGLAFTVAPIGGAALYELSGETAAWTATGLLGMAGAAVALAIDRPLRRRFSPGTPPPA